MEPEGSGLAFTSARDLFLSSAREIQSMTSHPTFWRIILILSSHLRLGLPSGLATKTSKHYLGPHTYYTPRPPLLYNYGDKCVILEARERNEENTNKEEKEIRGTRKKKTRNKMKHIKQTHNEGKNKQRKKWKKRKKKQEKESKQTNKQTNKEGMMKQDRQCTYTVTWGAFVLPLMQWKSNEYYTTWVCVFVALGSQHAMRVCAIISSVVCSALNISPQYITNVTILKTKNVIKHTMCVLIFSATFCLKHFSFWEELSETVS